jgi:hypothetical protein
MIQEIIDRLGSVAELKLVGGAAAFQAAAEKNPNLTPCAFVFPLEEDAAPNQNVNIVLQRVTAKVAVMLVVRNVSDAQGVAAGLDMTVLRQAVKASLLGWQPNAECDPLQRGAANLMLFKDGYMWWQDVYVTAFYDRSM